MGVCEVKMHINLFLEKNYLYFAHLFVILANAEVTFVSAIQKKDVSFGIALDFS